LKKTFHNLAKPKFYEIVPYSVTTTAEKIKKYNVLEFWGLFEEKRSFLKICKIFEFF